MFDEFSTRPKHFGKKYNTNYYRVPPAWQRWHNLYRIAPALKTLHETDMRREQPPPRKYSDGEFLRLCACFADPLQRDCLERLVFNLLRDRLEELLIKVLSERKHR